MAEMAKMN